MTKSRSRIDFCPNRLTHKSLGDTSGQNCSINNKSAAKPSTGRDGGSSEARSESEKEDTSYIFANNRSSGTHAVKLMSVP